MKDYRAIGAQFAKWRAVIADELPSQTCVNANAHALGRYAALCQEQGLVPIVEPEVLMEGAHTIERCYAVTGKVLHAIFNALEEQRVSLERMLLKPNMVVSGSLCPKQASVTEAADTTLRCLLNHVPAAVPGIVFLSSGQGDVVATVHLNAIKTGQQASRGKLAFPTGAHCKIRLWRHGWATGKTMGLLNRLIIIGPDAMRLRARASILRQWVMSLLAKS